MLASPGRYALEATFPMGGLKAPDPLTAQAEVELGGDRPKLIDRIQALDAAMRYRAAWDQQLRPAT